MKKAFILSIAIILSTASFSQEQTIVPLKDGVITYELTVDSVNMTKAELYRNAKAWLTTTFVSAKEVIQTDDREDGMVIGKGTFDSKYKFLLEQNISWTLMMKIQVKDGKYRIILTDEAPREYILKQAGKGRTYAVNMLKGLDDKVQSILSTFKTSMNTKDTF